MKKTPLLNMNQLMDINKVNILATCSGQACDFTITLHPPLLNQRTQPEETGQVCALKSNAQNVEKLHTEINNTNLVKQLSNW
jgi:hypothetical protein